MDNSRYDPFTYNPMLRAFYITDNFSDMPDTAAKLAAEQPSLANHVNAVWGFLQWLKNKNPQIYNVISNQRPDLVDTAHIVSSGAIVPALAKKGLAGLADGYDDTGVGIPSDTGAPVSQWGTDFLDFLKQTVPTYLQIKSQNDLMNINIKRAEMGLAPIDSSSLAPTVNVGVSKDVQTLGMVAIGGLVLVGLLSAFKKGR